MTANRRLPILLLALLAMTQPVHGSDTVAATDVDLLIVDGRVLDGLGNGPRRADVVIGGGRILFIGQVDRAGIDADKVIDADGRIVAPGFIDPHSHGDPLATPAFENFLAMGVTTITLGQDGSSPAVDDLGAWLEEVAAQGIGPNLAMLVGHGTLRRQAGIGLDPEPGDEQLAALLQRLDAALTMTFGMSTGLEYNPGLNAGFVELDSLARVVGSGTGSS